MNSPFKIAVQAHAEHRATLPAMARVLAESHDVELHLYVAKAQDLDFYRRTAGDAFARITVARNFYDPSEFSKSGSADVSALHRRARQLEDEIGVPLGHMICANRHLGRGYAPLGTGHPRSRFSETVDGTETLARAVDILNFWDHEIATHGFSAVIGFNKDIALAARRRGLPFRSLIQARFKNYILWTHDEYGDSPEIGPLYERHRDAGDTSDLQIGQTYKAFEEVLAEYKKSSRLGGALYRLGHRVAQQMYWRLRGFQKARGYYLTEDLKYIWKRYRHAVQLMSPDCAKLADMEGRPFVFFPLATEPELSMTQFSPEFFFQQAAIIAVSRDLPAGVTLVVKEHFIALGRRPSEFYRALRDLKNVVLLNVAEPGSEVAKKALATVTINGSAGFEAAVCGKPVLAFGTHNIYRWLDHVETVETLHDLRAPLGRVLRERTDAERAEAERQGALLLQTVSEVCVDAGEFDITKPNAVPDAYARGMAAGLVDSLTGLS